MRNGHSLSCDRQNLVITLMLLVKQCNCSARLGPSLKVSDPSRLRMGMGMGMGIAMRMGMGTGMGTVQMAKFAYLIEGCKTWQLGDRWDYATSATSMPSNVLCNSLRH